MNFLPFSTANVQGLSVLIRADLEIPTDITTPTDSRLDTHPRLQSALSVARLALDKQASRILLIGHKGKGIATSYLSARLQNQVQIDDDIRSDPRETQNDPLLAAQWGNGFDIYVNEAFGTSHRSHTSTVALPQYLYSQDKQVFLGPRFVQEIEHLDKVITLSGTKTLIVGGAKIDDKMNLALSLSSRFDHVLVGGKIPQLLDPASLSPEIQSRLNLGSLRPDGLDIDSTSITTFTRIISQSQVCVLAGPMGLFESDSSSLGTKQVFSAIAASSAYRVAGGGDTENALTTFSLSSQFDWISVGGGAMLYYLQHQTLPALQLN